MKHQSAMKISFRAPALLLFLMLTSLSKLSHVIAQDNTAPVKYNDIVVRDLKLFVEGKEFIFKAMAYQPMPLGYGKMDKDGYGGGGLCSPKKTPWSEWRSACWDSDLFDGSDGSFQSPPGPKAWFLDIWKRDMPLLKELGVNALRLYNVNPTTRLASEKFLSTGWNNILEPLGKDHRPFMDFVHSYGMKVMFPLVGDETALTNDDDEMLRNIIDEVGNHPALLMWVMGNEIDIASENRAFMRKRINDSIKFARQYTLQKWNRSVPLTTCVVDVPETYDMLAVEMDVEVFCANAGYRSDSLTDLFSGNPQRNFSGWKKLCKETGKPLLIGEIGWLSLNNSINEKEPQWFNKVWKDTLSHIDDGCIGGIFFEYSDEKYKAAGPDQTQLGVVELVPAYDEQGRSSEQPNVFIADRAVKKPIIFDAVKQGVLDGIPMNYNMDIFAYLGRPQATIPVVGSPPPTVTPPIIATPPPGTAPLPSGAPQGGVVPPQGGVVPPTQPHAPNGLTPISTAFPIGRSSAIRLAATSFAILISVCIVLAI